MLTDTPDNIGPSAREDTIVYEPPKVETVVTAADLERETLYAGEY